MSLFGIGALAIWHNVTVDVRDEFYEWHNREHMPERMAISGFRCGRRFRALEGQPEYFNLYETDNVEVLSSCDYLSRLNNPTAWTRRVVPGFRDVARSICRVFFSSGVGQGGVMVTQRFAVAPAESGRVVTVLCDHLLPAIAVQPGITGAHLCLADEAASTVATVEARARDTPTMVPSWIILLEGTAAPPVKLAAEAVSSAIARASLSANAETAVYQLEICRAQGHQP